MRRSSKWVRQRLNTGRVKLERGIILRSRVVFHADDLGLTESINLGIFQAIQYGLVRSTSIMGCGRAFTHATALLDGQSVCTGVHLTLDEETPVCTPSDVPSLVGQDGRFHSRATLMRKLTLSRQIDLSEVRMELEAQITKCLDAGIRVSHLDGHGHIHAHPRVAPIVVDLANKFGLKCIRVPNEPLTYVGAGVDPRRQLNKLIVLTMTIFSAKIFRRSGLASPAMFLGISHGGRVTTSAIRKMVDFGSRGSLFEIMCHPGKLSEELKADYGYWDYSWDSELRALMSDEIKEYVVNICDVVSLREAYFE
ncbi:MAG: Carbohydrate deacetylase [Nitrosomonadaceae bacterium]|nr:Carbohydrate deacetylase [Nitrosomonadaceae bacterium]